MANLRRAQTGSRVYRGVGTSPNMGQVSAQGAQGYLKRELRKPQRPVGNDGKSDSRSGVASRALGAIKGNLGNNIGRAPAGQPPKKNPNKVSSGIPNATRPTGSGAPAPVGGAPVAAPAPVQVNNTGQLSLPYDQNMSLEALEYVKQANDELYALQLEEQQMREEVTRGRRDAEFQNKQATESNLYGNAARGTAYSSGYAKDVADTATLYSNTLADLTNRENTFNQTAAARRATIQSTLSTQLAAAAQARQDEANANASDYATPEEAWAAEVEQFQLEEWDRINGTNNAPPRVNGKPPKKSPKRLEFGNKGNGGGGGNKGGSGGGPSNHNPVRHNNGGGGGGGNNNNNNGGKDKDKDKNKGKGKK